jgi:hypothetical protein
MAEPIRPQAGPQSNFLASQADIVIYGGAAGSGKSFGLLLEPLRHIRNKYFKAVTGETPSEYLFLVKSSDFVVN